MRKIDVESSDFDRISKLAQLFDVSPALIISKLLNYYEKSNTLEKSSARNSEQPLIRAFTADRLPPLVHTKLLSGVFSGKGSENDKWDSLLKLTLGTVYEITKNIPELKRISGANVVPGDKSDEGYKPFGKHPFSYQGQSATDVAQCVVRSAKALGCSASFEFEWRRKDAAAFPGERGRVTVNEQI